MSDSGAGDFSTDIAVVGMAGRFAGARNIDEYWRNLRDGVESLSSFSDEELIAAGVDPAQLRDPNYVKVGAVMPDMEMFDAPFFGFNPREASIMDPQHRHFIECAWEALENAGHTPQRFKGSIGVFGGSGHNAYMPYNLLTNPKLMSAVGFFLVRHTGNDKDFLTTRVSYLLNLKGPSVNVQTACSTSLVAIHLAAQSLLNGECDMALAGGVTIELPHRHGYTYREGEILSPDGHCHAFDAGSQGTVFGSGVGVVVLRRLQDALDDGDHIHAVIKGSAVNNDGSGKVGYLAPSVDGQAQAIAEALTLANVSADTITYVEAHGTGTPVGDPIEVAALTQAFRKDTEATGYCGIGSVKSNIGHTDTAAGVASFIKVALAMQHRQLPPSLFFERPNPACEFERSPFYVNATLQPWQPPGGLPRRAGVSSLGVGGTNAHLILEEAPPRAEDSPPRRAHQLLLLSARTATALDANAAALAEHLATHPELSLADVAYTLQVGREPMRHRRIVVAASTAEAAEALASRDAQRGATQQASEADRGVAFMFAGGGAQYPNMGTDLYRSEPVYRDAIDECLALLAKRSDTDYRSLLFPAAGAESDAAKALERPSKALPVLLATQVAQARLWMSWGIEPAAMIGHSMGEYTAAHLAGVFSLADALALVELRGRLFETLPEGGMLSVPLSEAELAPLMGAELSVAAVNGPKLTVASGPVAAIDALQRALEAQEIEAARVRISVAAHSSMLEPILREFGEFLRGVAMKPPVLPFVSNLSGSWITAAEATDPAYWVLHLRQTVRFADGLQELLNDDGRILLEVGPGRTLASLARQHPGRPAAQPVLNSLRHPDEQVSDVAYVLGQLGRLWAAGAPVDWDRVRGDERRLRVPLPTYRFDHVRHWVEPGKAVAAAPDAERSLDKRADLAEWFYEPLWQRTARPAAGTDGALPTLVFADATGLGDRLAERLRADGADVTLVRAGAGWRRVDERQFIIDPADAGGYEPLIAALHAEGRAPQRIAHLWTVGGASDADADTWQRLGFYSLLALAQAVGREDLPEPVQLMVVSDRMQRVAGESGLVPAKATLLGPVRVLPREFPGVRCRSVDVQRPAPGTRAERELVDALVAELGASDAHEVLAWRAGERWALDSLPRPVPPVAATALRERGVYLLTGGLGGVGLALAEHLARRVRARLVLVGRAALPPRGQWPAVAADAADPRAARVRRLLAIEALGSELLVVAADVSDAAQMRGVLRQARERFGTVHGVLHAAGVLDDGVIQLKDPAAAAAVLAPKLQGTLALHSAVEAEAGDAPPDFVVLFSSISAFAGLAGQVDYAAANAFLDAYAQSRVGTDGPYLVSIDWSQWQEVGMAASLAQALGLAPPADTEAPAGTPVDHPLLDRCFDGAPGERVYATRFSTATHWLLDEHRVRGGEALIPGTGYLELVRAAFAQQARPGAIELREVVFIAPFVVPEGETRELQVVLRADADGAAAFVVRSAGAQGQWLDNVRGRVARVAETAPAGEPLAAIAARCSERAHEPQLGEQPAHLQFGPRWANVRRIDYGRDEALVRLALPQRFEADLHHIELHPALVDMATAGAQALIPGFDEHADFFVPASYRRVRVHAPLTPRLASHVRLRRDDASGADLAAFDVTVTDEQGRALVEIEGFTMIRLRDKAQFARHQAPAAAIEAPHRPRATANQVIELGQREGILTAEGAEVLERVLAARPGPQVIVSPQDLKALLARLRAPASAAAEAGVAAAGPAGAGWIAPRTPTEQLIAQLWGELLGVERVGATDDFFELGGHSLLAVQVINKLKKRTGRPLALTALLEAPTVETLAALISPEEAAQVVSAAPAVEAVPVAGAVAVGVGDAPAAAAPAPAVATASAAPATVMPSAADRSAAQPPVLTARPPAGAVNRTLIRIRPGQGRVPVFLVHDGNGEVLLYRTLALQLHPQHAVYGLQPAVRADGSFIHTRITEMAAAHIEQMRTVQPHGPYLIAGLCAGGVISFEMAYQLQQAGEQVLFVGMFDAADVAAEERPFRVAKERLARLFGTVTDSERGVSLRLLWEAVPKVLNKVRGFAAYQVASSIERLRNRRLVQSMRDQAQLPAETASGDALAFLKMYEIAHYEHRPQGRFGGGDVVLYLATQGDGSPGDLPFREVYSDPQLGWAPRVIEALTVVDMPGGHSSMLQEPNVSVLARRLQCDIDHAMRRRGMGRAAAVAEMDLV